MTNTRFVKNPIMKPIRTPSQTMDRPIVLAIRIFSMG